MIQPSKYNGINFSGDFNRSSEKYNFGAQRVKNLIPFDVEIKYISFEVPVEYTSIAFSEHSNGETHLISNVADAEIELATSWIYFFKIPANTLNENEDVYFSLNIDGVVIYSEIYRTVLLSDLQSAEFCQIIASNNDDRHGYLTNQAFGFFKFSKLKSDIFLNKKTEYQYSYGRKKILSAENQIGKRFAFLDLTMYNANLLKWLCNCENLSIDGTSYQLISDFTEIEADPNSEIINLQADFVEVNQSFFATGTDNIPTNIFFNQFFN